MEYQSKRNVIKVEQPEIDIYDAEPFKDLLEGCVSRKGVTTVDFSMVEEMSTPAVQVLLSASKTLKKLNIKGVKPGLERDFFLLGVKLHD